MTEVKKKKKKVRLVRQKISIDHIWLACYFSSCDAISCVIPGDFYFLFSSVPSTRLTKSIPQLHRGVVQLFLSLYCERKLVKISLSFFLFCFWRKIQIICVFNLLVWGDGLCRGSLAFGNTTLPPRGSTCHCPPVQQSAEQSAVLWMNFLQILHIYQKVCCIIYFFVLCVCLSVKYKVVIFPPFKARKVVFFSPWQRITWWPLEPHPAHPLKSLNYSSSHTDGKSLMHTVKRSRPEGPRGTPAAPEFADDVVLCIHAHRGATRYKWLHPASGVHGEFARCWLGS